MPGHRSGRILAGIAIAAAVAAAGCAHSGGGGAGHPAGTAPSSAGPLSEIGTAPSMSGAGSALPPGFVATDMTFVSTDSGWLLGTAGCTAPACPPLVVHTRDGGRSWERVTAPGTPLRHPGIRFANESVGYLYGDTALYLTTNGARTWTQLPGEADAIEVANGNAVRISHDTPGCPPGCTYQISTAPVGSGQWQPVAVAGDPLMGVGVQLLRTGHRAFAEVFQHVTGGAQDAHATLLTSADDGRHWVRRADPCGTWAGQEADSRQLAVADDGSVTVLCVKRTTGPSFLVTSTDGGAGFGPQRRVPVATGGAVGAASSGTLLVAETNGSTVTLYRSTDGGGSWARVATAPGPAPQDAGTGVLGFENGRTGRWVPGSGAVLTTTDAGRTWVTYTFPG